MHRSRSARRKVLLATSCLAPVLLGPPVQAGPQDGRVVAGSATIASGGRSTTITQQSQSAIIDWRTFNIPAGHSATFIQPNATSSVLNRVTGRGGPSQIQGALTANGRVFLVNPDGILFGAGAQVNVGGLVATTHDISNQDFMAGKYQFFQPGNSSASVVNEGNITASSGGFAALVAPGVRNSGVISARLGTVALSVGNGFALDFYGDQLLNLKVAGDIPGAVNDVATGQVMPANVQNTGKLKANGGTVQLTAATARKVVDSVINNTGVIEANSVRQKGGTIILGAATAQTKGSGAPTQLVKVSGTLSAKGKRAISKGGEIRVTGEQVALVSANLDASGASGGGTIRVGGDIQGGAPKTPVTHAKAVLSAGAMPTADTVSIDRASSIDVSAIARGDAGKAVIWSERETNADGTISARGGSESGSGGFVEVSSRGALTFAALDADLTAAFGKGGTLLFDPSRFIIGAAEAANITARLNQGIQTIITADEDIRINADIIKTAGGDTWLEFYAGKGIYVAPNVTIGSTSGKLNIWFDADAGHTRLFANSISPNSPVVPNSTEIAWALTNAAGFALVNNLPVNSGLVGQPMSVVTGDIPAISQANVFVDPSARIFSNGGFVSVWGANYVISQASEYNYLSLPLKTVPDILNFVATQSGCSGMFYADKCGVNLTSTIYTDPAVPSRVHLVTFHVRRDQTVLPAGVLQAGAVPPRTGFQDVELVPPEPTRPLSPSEQAMLFRQQNPMVAGMLSDLANQVPTAINVLPVPVQLAGYAAFNASIVYQGGEIVYPSRNGDDYIEVLRRMALRNYMRGRQN